MENGDHGEDQLEKHSPSRHRPGARLAPRDRLRLACSVTKLRLKSPSESPRFATAKPSLLLVQYAGFSARKRPADGDPKPSAASTAGGTMSVTSPSKRSVTDA